MRRSRPRIVWGLSITVAAVAAAAIGLGVIRARRGAGAYQMERARAAYVSKDWNKAAALARRCSRWMPATSKPCGLLARASARQGRDSSANSLFHRLGEESLEAEDYFLLGLGLGRAGQTASAGRMWEKALSLDGDHAEALDMLARAYAASNRPDEAARLAERLAGRPGWELPGELMWARLRFELEDPAGAAKVLARALDRPEAGRLEPSSLADYRKMLVRALLRTGKPGAARRWLDPVRKAGPDPEASWLLSRAALQTGDIAGATAALRSSGSYRAEHRMEPEPSPYSGEARCAECHPEIAREQQASRHASTLVRGQDLAKLPYPDGPIPDPDDPAVVHRFRREGSSIRFDSEAAGAVRSAVIAYAFGSPDHYVSPVGPDDQGRQYILRLSHYSTAKDAGWVRTTGHTADASGGRDYLGKPLDVSRRSLSMPLLPRDQSQGDPRGHRARLARPGDRLRALPRAGRVAHQGRPGQAHRPGDRQSGGRNRGRASPTLRPVS